MNKQDFRFTRFTEGENVVFRVNHGSLRFTMHQKAGSREFVIAERSDVPPEILALEAELSAMIHEQEM